MTNPQFFTIEMIKGNYISWTKKAEITKNGTTVTIQQFKDEPTSIWLSTPTTYNRIAKDIEITEAIIQANNILKTL